MIPGVRLVLLGRQGAGKGTQCVRLARHFVVPHISTGDILRGAVREGSPFGLRAKEYMDHGDLLPDDVMIGIVAERLTEPDARTRGWVLDGFPRTVPQAASLLDLSSARRKALDVVVNLEVPRRLVLERLASRRVCDGCGTNYSTAVPPTHPWTCDVCGGKVIQRSDDTEEAIGRRLDLYDTQTAPLIAYFNDRKLLEKVDGVGAPDDVTDRIATAIEAHRRPAT